MIASWPEVMLMMQPGMRKGEMRRGPRSLQASLFVQMSGRPPMPEPMAQPHSGANSSVIHYVGTEAGDDIVRALGRIKYAVKSKTMRGENTEMAVEVFCKDPNMEFADRIRAVNGVQDVTLIQYNGEYHG